MKTNELKTLAREVGYGWAGWTVAVLSLTPFARVWGAARIPSAEAVSPAPQPECEAPVPATAPTPTRPIPLQVVTAPRVISLPVWTVAPPAVAPTPTAGKVGTPVRKPRTAPKPSPLTVPALRAEAKRRGLKGYSRLSRAALIALLAVAVG